MSLQKRGCWLNCVNKEKCAWFSYNPISTDCLLFESCSEIEENDLFFTGQKECEYSSIKSQYTNTYISFSSSLLQFS